MAVEKHNSRAKVAVLWDDSYLWGLIAYRTFSRLGIDFDLLSAEDIRSGRLAGHSVLFVPGGWASDKYSSLAEEGAQAVRDFVSAGGGYLGFCGGAGLALSHDSGLGLAPFGRLPTTQRLPSFSGRIVLTHTAAGHPIWDGVEEGAAFHAWWPGQFATEEGAAEILARYESPAAGSFVTDLPVAEGMDWLRWEEAYGINLDPGRISGEPAVAEVAYGQGRVVLSYLHFETPDDGPGNQVLLNLLCYLAGVECRREEAAGVRLRVVCEGDEEAADGSCALFDEEGALRVELAMRGGAAQAASGAAGTAGELLEQAQDFIEIGKDNFLWFWRNSWLLQWRRGVKGIEYSTLHGMLAELDRLTGKYDNDLPDGFVEGIAELDDAVSEFFREARRLILLERFAMMNGPLSPLTTDDEAISSLREKLFSTSKRCGGMYAEILKRADALMLPLLERENGEAAS